MFSHLPISSYCTERLFTLGVALALLVAGCSPHLAPPPAEPTARGALLHLHAQRLRSGYWSAQSIDSALAKYPQESELHYLKGRMHMESGQYADACLAMERASQLDSANGVYLLAYADALAESRVDGDSANLRLAKRLVRLQERNPEAWYRLALAYFQLQTPDSTIAICRQQGRLLAPYYSVNLLMASSFHQKAQCDSMLHYAQKAVERHEQLDNALYFTAQAAMMCDRQAELVEAFERAVELAAPDLEAWRVYTDYLCRAGAERQAVRSFLKIAQLHPDRQVNTLEILSFLLFSARSSTLGSGEYAAGFDSVFGKLTPTQEALFAQYRFYMVTRQPERSYQTVRQLSDAQPDAYYLWNLRKRIELNQMGDLRAAGWPAVSSTLLRMTEAFPFDASSALQYSFLVREVGLPIGQQIDTVNRFIGSYQQALRQAARRSVFTVRMDDSTSISMDRRHALRQSLSTLYATRGDLEAEAMDLQRAWKSYEEALRLDTANAVACNNYAYSLALNRTGRLDYARSLSERSLRYAPKNVNYLDTYGYILYLQGDYEGARAAFVRLLSIDKNPGRTALLHYSDVLLALGNSASAELYRMRAKEATQP